MGSTDVQLPKSHVPRWPDRCVVCEQARPGHEVDLATFRVTWWSTLTMSFGEREKVRVPACTGCARRLVWERRGRSLLALACVTIAMFGLPRLIGLPGGLWRTPAVLGYGLIGIVPHVVLEVFVPPPLDLTSHTEAIWYEFRSAGIAREFAEANAEAVMSVRG